MPPIEEITIQKLVSEINSRISTGQGCPVFTICREHFPNCDSILRKLIENGSDLHHKLVIGPCRCNEYIFQLQLQLKVGFEQSILGLMFVEIVTKLSTGQDCPIHIICTEHFPNYKSIVSKLLKMSLEQGLDLQRYIAIGNKCECRALDDTQKITNEEIAIRKVVSEINNRISSGQDCPVFIICREHFPNHERIIRKLMIETGSDLHHKLVIGPCRCCGGDGSGSGCETSKLLNQGHCHL